MFVRTHAGLSCELVNFIDHMHQLIVRICLCIALHFNTSTHMIRWVCVPQKKHVFARSLIVLPWSWKDNYFLITVQDIMRYIYTYIFVWFWSIRFISYKYRFTYQVSKYQNNSKRTKILLHFFFFLFTAKSIFKMYFFVQS